MKETLHQEEVECNDEKNEYTGFESFYTTTLVTIEKFESSNVTLVTSNVTLVTIGKLYFLMLL